MTFRLFCHLLLFGLGLSSCITDRNQGLNPKVVQETIVAQYPRIQACYTKAIGKDGHAGIIKAHFTIDKEGKARAIRLSDESLGTDKIDPCLTQEIQTLNFPKPKGGVDVAVAYPFKFEADKALTQAAIMGVLKGVNASLCFDEINQDDFLKVKLTIGKEGRLTKSTLAFDDTDLKSSSPCLARILRKQKFPKIASKQFQSVSIFVTFQADDDEQWLSEAR